VIINEKKILLIHFSKLLISWTVVGERK